MSFTLISTVLQFFAYTALAVRLVSTGLARTYRWLTAFLIFEALRIAVVGAIPRNRSVYAIVYFASEPLYWLLCALMTLEVFQAAFRQQPGIATASRRAIAVCVGVSVAFAVGTMAFNVQQHNSPYVLLENYLTLERVITSSLLFFVILLIAMLAWFPVPLTRNAMAHSAIFAFFFGSLTTLLLLRNIYGPWFATFVNALLPAVTISCVLLWGFLLTAEGEKTSVRSGYRRNTADEERLIRQLETLNQTLMGAARK